MLLLEDQIVLRENMPLLLTDIDYAEHVVMNALAFMLKYTTKIGI